MTNTLAIFLVLLQVFMALTGIAIDIYYERSRWSKLIEEGRLPKPTQKRHRA